MSYVYNIIIIYQCPTYHKIRIQLHSSIFTVHIIRDMRAYKWLFLRSFFQSRPLLMGDLNHIHKSKYISSRLNIKKYLSNPMRLSGGVIMKIDIITAFDSIIIQDLTKLPTFHFTSFALAVGSKVFLRM